MQFFTYDHTCLYFIRIICKLESNLSEPTKGTKINISLESGQLSWAYRTGNSNRQCRNKWERVIIKQVHERRRPYGTLRHDQHCRVQLACWRIYLLLTRAHLAACPITYNLSIHRSYLFAFHPID